MVAGHGRGCDAVAVAPRIIDKRLGYGIDVVEALPAVAFCLQGCGQFLIGSHIAAVERECNGRTINRVQSVTDILFDAGAICTRRICAVNRVALNTECRFDNSDAALILCVVRRFGHKERLVLQGGEGGALFGLYQRTLATALTPGADF